LNEQGFIEGRYVPVLDGKPVASGVSDSAVTDATVPAETNKADEGKLKDFDGDNGVSSKVLPTESAPAN
jgi:hypothetical protein